MLKPRPFKKKLSGRQRFRRLAGDKTKKYGLRSGLVVLRPQESVGAHDTKDKEEAIIIIKGKAKVSYGNKSSLVLSGESFMYMPPHTRHDVKNIGKGLLKYVYVTALKK